MESVESGGTVKDGQLTNFERSIVFSPLRLVLMVGLAVFTIEILVMVLIELVPKMHPAVEFVVDSSLLTLLLSPILYKQVFRPLLHLIANYRANEIELRDYQEELESKVMERTSDLDEAIKLLEQEIAVRRTVEASLRDSEDRIRQILSQSEDAIVLFEPATLRIADVNPTAERLFERQRDELLSLKAGNLCDARCSTQLTMSLGYVKEAGDTSAIEQLVTVGPDGAERILSFRCKIIRLQGEPHIYATFRDITRRVRMEEEARETQRKLLHVNRMTSLGMLVSSVAHDINNPNHYILMNAGLLQKSWQDILASLRERYDRQGDFRIGSTTFLKAEHFLPQVIDGIYDGARQINGIVENLRNFIRDEQTGNVVTADINESVRISVAILTHHISRCTRHFRLELGETLPLVRSNGHKLEQVIINLIMNALQSLPSLDRGVHVSTGIDDEGLVMVTVSDEGCGIPDDIAARIFEPFFTTRLEKGGTGLGLSIATEIVREQGGSLDFTSVLGKGTEFIIRLQPAKKIDISTERCDVQY